MYVEGIGKVSATFTTLGIAQSLTEGFNTLALLSTICFALFGLAWFSARLIYERNAKAEEDKILAQIGWRSSVIKRRNIYEQFFVLTTAFLVSIDRKSTRLNSSHVAISYAGFCLKKN